MVPLYTVQQVRDADKYAVDQLGIPGIVLMENASVSIWEIFRRNFPGVSAGKPVGFVCGKGNNAGDGFAVARHFINAGFRVEVVYIADLQELKGDAAANFSILRKLTENIPGNNAVKFNTTEDLNVFSECSVLFDCLLGTGTAGDIKEPYKTIIDVLNNLEVPKIAVDIPSGLNADTGAGEYVIKADLTVTLAALKRGLFVNRGAVASGRIIKGYIGMPDNWFENQTSAEFLIEEDDALEGLPLKQKDAYKYSAGKVLVVAGSSQLPGAAVLTSKAVMQSGAGAVYLAFPESAKTVAQSMLSEVILHPYNDLNKGFFIPEAVNAVRDKFDWMDVLAIGPGLGRDSLTREAIISAVKNTQGKKIVIDADAIYALAENVYKELNLHNCILTPHHAEFAHLLGVELKKLQSDIFHYGRTFAAETSSYLVLKGAPTVIFNPQGEVFINTAGNPGMAKFGTGDVLTGVIAGFLAQSDEIEKTLISAVYLHSLSADLLLKSKTEFSFVASDLISNLPLAINHIRNHSV